MTETTQAAEDLLQQAHDEGDLSGAAMQALQVPDIGAQIQAGLGIDPDLFQASEAVLVSLLCDDSFSMLHRGPDPSTGQEIGNDELLIEGYNMILGALGESKQKSQVLLHTRYLNGEILTPFSPLDGAATMTPANYQANGGTPLYDQMVLLLGTVMAKATSFAEKGIPCRTITCIITDGRDEHSQDSEAGDVKAIVDDMLQQETHIVAAMGIEDGRGNFQAVFQSMGLRDQWILTPQNSPGEIRKAMAVFSRSTTQAASQGGGAFTRQQAGGFAP